MTQPHPEIDAEIREAFERVHRVTAAHRILPDHLKEYAHVATVEIDWLGLVERASRHGCSGEGPPCSPSDRATVALIAHLLGFPEALRVAPADTFMGLLELVDRDTRSAVMAAITMMHALLEL